jgi:hypothetical protein
VGETANSVAWPASLDSGRPGHQVALADVHRHALRLRGAGGQAPDLARLAVDQAAVARAAQEAHRLALVEGDLPRLAAGQRLTPDVEAAAALAEPQHRVFLRAPHGIAVLAAEPRQAAVAAVAPVKQPDVARRLRHMVLAPFIFERAAVGVQQPLAIGAGRHVQRWRGQQHRRPAACGGHGVELLQPAQGLGHVQRIGLRRAEPGRGKQDLAAVRAEGLRHVRGRVEGQPRDRTAGSGHDEHVVVAMPARREGDALPVGRPDRVMAVERARRQRARLAAGSGHDPDLAAVREGNAAAVGRHRRGAQPEWPLRIGRRQGRAVRQANDETQRKNQTVNSNAHTCPLSSMFTQYVAHGPPANPLRPSLRSRRNGTICCQQTIVPRPALPRQSDARRLPRPKAGLRPHETDGQCEDLRQTSDRATKKKAGAHASRIL